MPRISTKPMNPKPMKVGDIVFIGHKKVPYQVTYVSPRKRRKRA